MQLIDYNIGGVSRLSALQQSSRQRYNREPAHFTLYFDVLLPNQLNFNVL